MNYFQLVLKQMRQRALSTWLTTLSVMLGVGLAVAIMVMGRESQNMFGQNDYGYDVLIGVKASPLQLVLNSIYHIDQSPGNIPFSVYGRLLPGGDLYDYSSIAVPFCVGDTLNGQYRIIGTLPKLFGFDDNGNKLPPEQVMDYRPGKKLEIDQGTMFAANKFQAVIGSEISRLTGKKIGDTFQATHGIPIPGEPPDIHMQVWTITGVIAPTHTAIDRCVYIPLNSFYTIAEHGAGLLAQAQLRQGNLPSDKFDPDSDSEGKHDPDANGIRHYSNYDLNDKDGTIKLKLPPEIWAVSGIQVQSRGGVTAQSLIYDLSNSTEVMAVNPAEVMRQFFDTFLRPTRKLLLVICSLVTIVAAVGILVSIYNSVSARLKEIAILRALGATRGTVLTLICLEAGVIALFGSILGVVLGHAINGVGAWYMLNNYGENLEYENIELAFEAAYVAGVVVLAVIAGLVPALKAYSTPVATNLVAS